MLTLDIVRTAVLSDQPWARLDELVRAELASGQTTRQIYTALMAFADDIDAIPGLTEDRSDAFGDTLDKLTGYCRADQCYQDPPNTTLPDADEIARLPLWARVAFAGRCAERVFPLTSYFWPDIPEQALAEVKQAVETAQRVARDRGSERRVGADASAAATVSEWDDVWDDHARFAIRAAEHACLSAYLSLTRDGAVNDATILETIHALDESRSASPIADLTPHIRRDFDHLASLAEWQKWDDDTPVPPEVFGPLWPEGPPKGWPPVSDVPQRAELVIEAFARDRATEQMIEDDIVHLFNALNRYHIARSGARLTLDQFRSLLPALVPVEV